MQRNADATRWGWDARGGRQRWFWRWRSDARKVHASAASATTPTCSVAPSRTTTS